MPTKKGILANIVGAVEKEDTGTGEQQDFYWTWDRSRDIVSPTQIAFALKRNAWSDTIDFYKGGLYRFYISVS